MAVVPAFFDDQFSLLRGQDIDRGNVEEACNTVSYTNRARFGPNKLPAGKCHLSPLLVTYFFTEIFTFTVLKLDFSS